jgi:hypothetical protein
MTSLNKSGDCDQVFDRLFDLLKGLNRTEQSGTSQKPKSYFYLGCENENPNADFKYTQL